MIRRRFVINSKAGNSEEYDEFVKLVTSVNTGNNFVAVAHTEVVNSFAARYTPRVSTGLFKIGFPLSDFLPRSETYVGGRAEVQVSLDDDILELKVKQKATTITMRIVNLNNDPSRLDVSWSSIFRLDRQRIYLSEPILDRVLCVEWTGSYPYTISSIREDVDPLQFIEEHVNHKRRSLVRVSDLAFVRHGKHKYKAREFDGAMEQALRTQVKEYLDGK